ncbi:MAG: Dam family site-specific DNA-(adenine-N6)-methyltransferase [Clostridiales bacterium]|nr:Dam family site-specific DNA-(adenine-N6)-methyltransferase [Clostridiales bacterium]
MFPDNINTFIDVFGGSGTVLLNVKAKSHIYNDINNYVADIFRGIVEEDDDTILTEIDALIEQYSLSKTNKVGFEQLRSDYNGGKKNWVVLYTLMCYSFNYQFRFNNAHQYNSSFGKERSCFSENQRRNLIAAKARLRNTAVMNLSFEKIDYSKFGCQDFFYFDPPYLNSVGNYNDGKRGFEGWTSDHEKNLYEVLDDLDRRNIRFALSNNLKYDNPILVTWLEKYKVHYLNGDYSNCNYQKKDKSTDLEVLITNY